MICSLTTLYVGTNLLRLSAAYILYFFIFKWQQKQARHDNVIVMDVMMMMAMVQCDVYGLSNGCILHRMTPYKYSYIHNRRAHIFYFYCTALFIFLIKFSLDIYIFLLVCDARCVCVRCAYIECCRPNLQINKFHFKAHRLKCYLALIAFR